MTGTRPAEAEGASGLAAFALMAWIVAVTLLGTALLVVVPAFEKMFTECGLCLPAVTEALLAASHGARTIPGAVAIVLVHVASLAAFHAAGGRRSLATVFGSLAAVAVAALLVVGWALFAPLISLPGKL